MGMRLAAYLEQTGESERSFARRAGIPATTLDSILREKVIRAPRGDTCHRIIIAAGGLVSLDDLVGNPGAAQPPQGSA